MVCMSCVNDEYSDERCANCGNCSHNECLHARRKAQLARQDAKERAEEVYWTKLKACDHQYRYGHEVLTDQPIRNIVKQSIR